MSNNFDVSRIIISFLLISGRGKGMGNTFLAILCVLGARLCAIFVTMKRKIVLSVECVR
jgi:hypothetical protein